MNRAMPAHGRAVAHGFVSNLLTARDSHGQEHGHMGRLFRQAGCRRSWLPYGASAIAGGQPARCPYSRPGARVEVRFLGLNRSRSVTPPAAMKVRAENHAWGTVG